MEQHIVKVLWRRFNITPYILTLDREQVNGRAGSGIQSKFGGKVTRVMRVPTVR